MIEVNEINAVRTGMEYGTRSCVVFVAFFRWRVMQPKKVWPRVRCDVCMCACVLVFLCACVAHAGEGWHPT